MHSSPQTLSHSIASHDAAVHEPRYHREQATQSRKLYLNVEFTEMEAGRLSENAGYCFSEFLTCRKQLSRLNLEAGKSAPTRRCKARQGAPHQSVGTIDFKTNMDDWRGLQTWCQNALMAPWWWATSCSFTASLMLLLLLLLTFERGNGIFKPGPLKQSS